MVPGTGKVVTPLKGFGRPDAVVVQPEDRIVVAGTVGDFVREGFALVRYLPNESLDPSFGTDGVVRKGFARTATVQDDGKLLVIGVPNRNGDFMVIRYLGS